MGILILVACAKNNKKPKNSNTIESSQSEIRYAKGFRIESFKTYKIITLLSPWKGSTSVINYVLYSKEKPLNVTGVFVKTPIRSIACLSLTHIAFLEKLKLQQFIVGISGCNFVSSSKILKQIETKQTIEIGQNEMLNYELLVNIAPSIIMTFGIDESSNKRINKLKSLGLVPVLNSEYMETHPLGQAEWIKFMAAFFNKEQRADSIFNEIEKEYLSLTEITHQIKSKPTVFTGMPWNGAWYVPGGLSFQAQLFRDAGAAYLWADNTTLRSVIKSKEVILNEAIDADFWLNVNAYNSIDQIIKSDALLRNFKALKEQKIYNNNLRENLFSGNDYWESGVVNPHIVLKDLIKIFHPELVEHELFYYKKLE